MNSATPSAHAGYNRFLLLVAGLGGLLYGVDVGIIAGALPYLEATSGLNAGQLSFIVAAVLLGSVISTLFAGMLADWMGRKPLMALSGVLFVASIPMIALSRGYGPLVLGRLLQGISAGFIGVVVPLYLAECLGAANRGKGTGIFQWLLTLGIVAAAVIGIYFSIRVEEVAKLGDAALLHDFKDRAWRGIFWVSLPPGLLFVAGSLFVTESPRWLYRRGRKDSARAALLRSRPAEQAEVELREMAETEAAEHARASSSTPQRESLLHRKYVVPFVLACVILACNQTTGVNSIIGYNTTILLQGGLSDVQAHWGYLVLTLVNFLCTIVGVVLVDRRGRKFLLSLGSAGIIAALLCVGLLFRQAEAQRLDVGPAVQATVAADQTATVKFTAAAAEQLLAASGAKFAGPSTLVVIYSYGGFRTATKAVRSDDPAVTPLVLNRAGCVPPNKVVAFFTNPLADLDEARSAPLRIDRALVTPVPSTRHGWLTALGIFAFMACFAVGPGVCVWLALSELMPTRIRSNGMSIALLVNQAVSTFIAAIFLPTVGKYGYSAMFFAFAGCTVVYFVTAAFFLPETKGKTLEEI
ncbi:MAG: MFS transporter, partial [Opitutales bacterium]